MVNGLESGGTARVLPSTRARVLLAVALLAAAVAGLKAAGADLGTAAGIRDFQRFLLPTLVLCGCFAGAALLPRRSKAALWYRSALPLAAGLAVVVLLHDRGRIFDPRHLLGFAWLVPFFFLVWKFRGAFEKAASGSRIGRLMPLVVVAGVLFIALLAKENTFRCGSWFYFLQWWPRDAGGRFGSGLARLALITGALTPLFLVIRRRLGLATGAVALFSVTACLVLLFRETHGLPLYRDDHPSFIFRLWEFGRTFPQFVNYNPFWNAGTIDSALLTTGVTAVGLPTWPLWRFADPATAYTPVIAMLFIVLMPLLAGLSLRIMGANWTAAACAAALALGVSQRFFLWLLNYGTVGACFATSFVLPVAACAFRVVWLGRREKWLFALLVLFSLFLVSWPPGLIMGGGVLLAVLCSADRLSRGKVLFLAGFGAVLAAVLAYPVALIMGMKELLGFVGRGGEATAQGTVAQALLPLARKGWENLFVFLGEGHPLIVFLGVVGVFFSPHRSVRRWFVPIILYLAILAGWGELVKPKMQLMRMAIPMMFVAVAPAALACSKLLALRRRALAPVRALIVALLLLGGWNTARIYGNQWNARYVTPSAELAQMNAWFREHTPAGGRILFAGRAVHAFGRGHVAPLPIFTGREMMGFDYYHFPGGDYEYPPRPHRESLEGMSRFFDLYNVTHLVTYHERWKATFRSRPDLFEESAQFGDKTVFAVRRAPAMFLSGAGTVDAGFNRIRVTVSDPAGEAVVKYNWVDGMKTDPPAELFPYRAGEDITLVGIRPNGVAAVTVRF